MSKTYRKNIRLLTYIHGHIVSSYCNVSLKVPKIEDVIGCSYDMAATRMPKIVKVADVDCYGSGLGHKIKSKLHQIDRSRQKIALHRHLMDDCNCYNSWVSSYNPWDYD